MQHDHDSELYHVKILDKCLKAIQNDVCTLSISCNPSASYMVSVGGNIYFVWSEEGVKMQAFLDSTNHSLHTYGATALCHAEVPKYHI